MSGIDYLLTQQERSDLGTITRLLDEAYQHYFDNSDGYCKSSEGHVSVGFGTTFDRRSGERVRHVEVYSYVFGPHRQHYFDSISSALSTVQTWHAAEMATDYAALEAEEAAFWAAREDTS